MKFLNFYLVILNIVLFPGLTLAQSNQEVNSKASSTSHPQLESATADKDQSKAKPEISEPDNDSSDSKASNENDSNQSTEQSPQPENEKLEDENSDNQDSDLKDSGESPEPKPETKNPEAKDKVKKPTPEELARLAKLAAADKLYLAGDKAAAAKLYRQAKDVWSIEQARGNQTTVATFTVPGQLSPAGRVFWRNYQQGKKQQLETKVVTSLKLLTTREPQFLPGHIDYAKALKEYEREAESNRALNRAVNLYPNEPELVKAKMNADIAADKWLDASIMARQFALFNPDLPEAKEFDQLADKYLAKYQSNLRSSIRWNAIGNAIAGTVGFALTGNLFGPISAIETTALLLQGESAVGESSVAQIKKQLPLLEDQATTEYVQRIGQKVAAASGRDEFDYQFHLVMDDNLNAFALPGGKIFVNAGAIMKTDSEAELAGLLAHEVSHSALSHGFQLVTKGNLTANIVSYVPYVGNVASSLIVLNYSRSMEKQADVFGTRILVNAGYAADGVRNLMLKLEQAHQDKDNPEPVTWLSSHPNSNQRVRYMEQLIVDNGLNRYAYEGVAPHQEIKKSVTAQWQKYEKCIEDVKTIKEAKKCAGEKDAEKTEQKKQTDQDNNQTLETNEENTRVEEDKKQSNPDRLNE